MEKGKNHQKTCRQCMPAGSSLRQKAEEQIKKKHLVQASSPTARTARTARTEQSRSEQSRSGQSRSGQPTQVLPYAEHVEKSKHRRTEIDTMKLSMNLKCTN